MDRENIKSESASTFFKRGSFALVVLGIFLIVATLNAFKDWQNVDAVYNSISVTGQGESVSVPDIATFSFSVSADAKTVSDAQAQVTKSTDAIFAGLKDLGVVDTDIKTIDYSVYPKYSYTPVSTLCPNGYCPPSRQILDGYTVNQSVLIKIRKIADAGKALALVGDKGATNVSGLNFTTDDPNKNQNEARANAIDDAKAKADTLAKHLGVKIVRVVGYADDSSNPVPIYGGYAGISLKTDVALAPTIPVGQNKVTANVTVTYEIR
jgi:uncharacterized protein YggE